MQFKKSDIKKYFIGIIIFWCVLIVFYFLQKDKLSNILKNPNYTVGLVNGIQKYNTGDDYYRYKYSIDSKDYQKGIGASSSNNIFIGTRYFVIFEKGKPKNAMLLPFILIPDSIQEAPSEGWKELPIPVDKEEIRKFLEDY